MLFFNVYYSENEDRKEAVVEFDAICGDSSYGLQNGTKEWIEDSLTCIEVLGRALKGKLFPADALMFQSILKILRTGRIVGRNAGMSQYG